MNVEQKKRVSQNWLWLSLLVAFLVALWTQWPRLNDPFLIEDDFRSMYWMHRFQDHKLFVDDPLLVANSRIIEFDIGTWKLIMDSGSPGYSLLYQAASYFVSPNLFSKLLMFPLLLVSIFYLYRIGEQLRGQKTAFILCLAFIAYNVGSSTAFTTIVGLQRSFTFPLLLSMAYYLTNRRDKTAAFIIFLSGIIYPPIFLVNATAYGLSLIRWQSDNQWKLSIEWKRIFPLLVAVSFALAALTPIALAQLNKAQPIETTAQATHILLDPVYRQGGRYPMFHIFPFVGPGGLISKNIDFAYIIILLVGALLILITKKSATRRLPSGISRILYASFICYIICWLSIFITSSFILYKPSRYTRGTIFLALLIFVIINAREASEVGGKWVSKQGQRLIWIVGPVVLLSLVPFFIRSTEEWATPFAIFLRRLSIIFIVFLLFLTAIIWRRHRHKLQVEKPPANLSKKQLWLFINLFFFIIIIFFIQFYQPVLFHTPLPEERGLLAYLETLPKDTLLAGNPCSLDDVQALAKRMALFTCERPHGDPEVMMAGMEAYYAENQAQVAAFCQTYGIDYLVVDEETFTDAYLQAGVYLFEPFDSMLGPSIQNRDSFVLNQVPQEKRLFQVDTLFVVPCTSDSFS